MRISGRKEGYFQSKLDKKLQLFYRNPYVDRVTFVLKPALLGAQCSISRKQAHCFYRVLTAVPGPRFSLWACLERDVPELLQTQGRWGWHAALRTRHAGAGPTRVQGRNATSACIALLCMYSHLSLHLLEIIVFCFPLPSTPVWLLWN